MMIKSFINYPGGKYSIIEELINHFPQKCERFVDIFGGSGVVTANYNGANHYKLNDINASLIELIKYVISNNPYDIENKVDDLIKKYQLSDSYRNGYSYYTESNSLSEYNRAGFLKLRENYNSRINDVFDEEIKLYALIIFGFNNQIRFNKKGLFNNPVGKRDFNSSMREKLFDFSLSLSGKHVEITNDDYINMNIQPFDFVYADPPYLITNAVYNDGSNGWNESNEKNLIGFLDNVDKVGAKFALSNVLIHKGNENKILINWSKKYRVIDINKNYKNSSYNTKKEDSREVLIVNY